MMDNSLTIPVRIYTFIISSFNVITTIVIAALRDHANGGLGTLKLNDYDEIESHCLNRLFEELVEEPSNILYVTPTSPSTTRYNSMDPSFWIECLDLLEREIISNISNQ